MAEILGDVKAIVSGDLNTSKKDPERIQVAEKTQKKSMSGGIVEDLAFGLPGRIKAEQDIQNRENPIEGFRDAVKELEKDPSNDSIKEKILKHANVALNGAIVGAKRTWYINLPRRIEAASLCKSNATE